MEMSGNLNILYSLDEELTTTIAICFLTHTLTYMKT
jgi:hypothetical protein